MHRMTGWAFLYVVLAAAQPSVAAIIVNAPMPVTRLVTVQPIIVSNDDGTNTAAYFGDALQQGTISGFVNTIWAQAGIQVNFLTPNAWNNTFANIGTPGMNDPRPTSDLANVVFNGDGAAVGSADPVIVDMYFVEIAAGFPATSENTANGLAFVGASGITQHVGDNLLGFTGGQEVVASVVAHEIGHNLGLEHTIADMENLMQPGGSGERLNNTQIMTARLSPLATAVPEPASGAVLTLLMACFVSRQVLRRRAVGV